MNIEEQLQNLSHQNYHHTVDVVDGVMEQVRRHPYLRPRRVSFVLRRVAGGAAVVAAAAIALLVVNRQTSSASDARISDMIAQVTDYDNYAPIESLATDPYEFFAEKYE